MSDFRIDKITNRDGSAGTQIAGITTFSGTSGMQLPVGPTEYRGGRGRAVRCGGRISPNNRSDVPPSTVLIDDSIIFGADGSLVSVDANIPKISKTSGVLRDIFSSCTRVPNG